LLIWPNQGNPLSHRLELNLIKRYAKRLGAQIALVTQFTEVHFLAHQVGIPVFTSLQNAERSPWQVEKQGNTTLYKKSKGLSPENLRQSQQSHSSTWLERAWIRIVCTLASLLAVFVLGIFILPSATIVVNPEIKIQSITLAVSTDPSLTEINRSTGSLPAYYQEVIVEGTDSLTTTGSMLIPDQEAVGVLRFTNISDHVVEIPAGTVVSTLGSDLVFFSISAKEKIVVAPGESVMLSAQAIEPGTSGNLPEDTLQVIESQIGLDMTVTNPSATFGGTDASVPAPSTQDFQELRERLESKLALDALAELQSSLSPNELVISSSQNNLKVIEEIFTPPAGEPGKELSLSLRIHYRTQVVSGEVLRSLVTPIMDANNSTDYSPITNTYVFSQVTVATVESDGVTRWKMRAERKLQVNIPDSQVTEQIKGKSVSNAYNAMEKFLPQVREALISLRPSWWPYLPLLPMRIQIEQPVIQ
jgi:hypothetical protein